MMLAMVNRARNKKIMMEYMKETFEAQSVSILEASKLFMRINGVYKQASIERQAVKRKDLKDRPHPLFSGVDLMSEWPEIELAVQQNLRMSRLRASTSLSGTPLNLFLMEYTPSQRVLSGEIIVF